MSATDLTTTLQHVTLTDVQNHLARLGCRIDCPDPFGWRELSGGREFADCEPAPMAIDGVVGWLVVQAIRSAGDPASARVDILQIVPAPDEELWAERLSAALAALFRPGDDVAVDPVFSPGGAITFTLFEHLLLVARRGAV